MLERGGHVTAAHMKACQKYLCLPPCNPSVVSSLGLALRISRKAAAHGNHPQPSGPEYSPKCLDRDCTGCPVSISGIRRPFVWETVDALLNIQVHYVVQQGVGPTVPSPASRTSDRIPDPVRCPTSVSSPSARGALYMRATRVEWVRGHHSGERPVRGGAGLPPRHWAGPSVPLLPLQLLAIGALHRARYATRSRGPVPLVLRMQNTSPRYAPYSLYRPCTSLTKG